MRLRKFASGKQPKTMGRALVVAAILVCALTVALVALSGGWAQAADTVNVSILSNSFSPTVITIEVGDTVTWTNTDDQTHTTTSNSGVWDSGNMAADATFSHTFATAGTFIYICSIHGFSGQVIVNDASSTSSSGSSSTTSSSSTTTSSSTTSTTASPGTAAFVDVPAGSQYFTAIEGLADAGYISGYDRTDGQKEFRPQNSLLRAQFAKIIVGALQLPVVPNAPIPFTDVGRDANGYPADYVAVAYNNQITQGLTATQFAPYVSINRAQATTLVVRALQHLHSALPQDPPIGYQNAWGTSFSSIHGPLARIAEYNGLLAGLPLTTTAANPLGVMSRGEVAQLLWNMVQLIQQ